MPVSAPPGGKVSRKRIAANSLKKRKWTPVSKKAVRHDPFVETMARPWRAWQRGRHPGNYVSTNARCQGLPRDRNGHRRLADLSQRTKPALTICSMSAAHTRLTDAPPKPAIALTD